MRLHYFTVPVVLGAALLLAACVTAQDLATNITTVSQTANEKVTSVKSYTMQLCKYVPTAATIVKIFSSGYASDVATVANAICDAVTTAPLADGPGDRIPRVNNVVVKGKFVR